MRRSVSARRQAFQLGADHRVGVGGQEGVDDRLQRAALSSGLVSARASPSRPAGREMCGAVIVMFRSRVLWKGHRSNVDAAASSWSTTWMNSANALHHEQQRNCTRRCRGREERRQGNSAKLREPGAQACECEAIRVRDMDSPRRSPSRHARHPGSLRAQSLALSLTPMAPWTTRSGPSAYPWLRHACYGAP